MLDELEAVVAVEAGHVAAERPSDPQRRSALEPRRGERNRAGGTVAPLPQRLEEDDEERAGERQEGHPREDVIEEKRERRHELGANADRHFARLLVVGRHDDVGEHLPHARRSIGRPGDDDPLFAAGLDRRSGGAHVGESGREARRGADVLVVAADGDAGDDERLRAVVLDRELRGVDPLVGLEDERAATPLFVRDEGDDSACAAPRGTGAAAGWLAAGGARVVGRTTGSRARARAIEGRSAASVKNARHATSAARAASAAARGRRIRRREFIG